jgi:Protein of unknown function (DUF3618)
MATEADRIRKEIEATRAELARDVDRLAEHASPTGMARRRLARLRDGVKSVKDKVIGVSEDAASTASTAASTMASTVASTVAGAAADAGAGIQQAPKKLVRVTQGSPVAVGVIAFGSGLLAAALIKESEAERRVARQVTDALGPALEPLQQAGRAFADDVRATVESAADEVRATAIDAATGVGAAAAAGATDVRTSASEAAAHTLHDATDRSRAIIEQTRRPLDS